MTVKLFEVGGCVRDELLGIPSKDVDFVAVAPSFDALRDHLVGEGFKIYIENPEFVTIRASVPKGHALRSRTKDADFVLARKDGPSSDGRRPDFVEAGTLEDDLRRRDFTVNALARGEDGELVDLFGGVDDLNRGVLRFVGDPLERIKEDGLRVLRAFRFKITKGFLLETESERALYSDTAVAMLGAVSPERIREELEKMLKHDTMQTVRLMNTFDNTMLEMIFQPGLRLSATLKK